jgi:hypothetical protein
MRSNFISIFSLRLCGDNCFVCFTPACGFSSTTRGDISVVPPSILPRAEIYKPFRLPFFVVTGVASSDSRFSLSKEGFYIQPAFGVEACGFVATPDFTGGD